MLCSVVMFDLVDFLKIDTNKVIHKYFDEECPVVRCMPAAPADLEP